MWDRFKLVYCIACATYLDKVYGGAAQKGDAKEKDGTACCGPRKRTALIHAMGISH